mgnify:FL=1
MGHDFCHYNYRPIISSVCHISYNELQNHSGSGSSNCLGKGINCIKLKPQTCKFRFIKYEDEYFYTVELAGFTLSNPRRFEPSFLVSEGFAQSYFKFMNVFT